MNRLAAALWRLHTTHTQRDGDTHLFARRQPDSESPTHGHYRYLSHL